MPVRRKTGPRPPWEAIDAAVLRQFLATVTGQRFIDQIFYHRPKASELSDPVKRAMQSCLAGGYEEMFEKINHLTLPASTSIPLTNAEATAKAVKPPSE